MKFSKGWPALFGKTGRNLFFGLAKNSEDIKFRKLKIHRQVLEVGICVLFYLILSLCCGQFTYKETMIWMTSQYFCSCPSSCSNILSQFLYSAICWGKYVSGSVLRPAWSEVRHVGARWRANRPTRQLLLLRIRSGWSGPG